MRKCPYCAEEIQDDETKCKHCGEWLNKQDEPSSNKDAFSLRDLTPVVLLQVSAQYALHCEESLLVLIRKDFYCSYYLSARKSIDHGDYEAAIVTLTKAIELDPKDAMTYSFRASAYGVLGNYNKALADCNKAIELNPKYALAYYSRGLAYLKLGNYNQSIADNTKAIELNPKYALAYYNRGLAYLELDNYNKALVDSNKAIELNPKYALAYFLRGAAYDKLGNKQESLDNFKVADRVLSNEKAQNYLREDLEMEPQKRITKIRDCGNKLVDPDFLIEKLKKDERERILQIAHFQIWVKRFKECQHNPYLFLGIPWLIDEILVEADFLCKNFSKKEWMELHRETEKIRKIAKETEEVRKKYQMLNKRK